jgi:2-hydroxychromene-2-carboxylate isomerase
MPKPRTVTVYIDYKSPYAYLAKDYGSEARP